MKQTCAPPPLKKISLLLILAILIIPFTFKAQTIAVDTLGSTLVTGCMHVDSSMVVADTIIAKSDVNITGNINLKGALNFDTNTGFNFTKATSSLPDIFTYGKIGNPPPPTNPCFTGFNTGVTAHLFQGYMQVVNDVVPNSTILTFLSSNTGSSIDVSGGGTTSSPGLLINYFCGKDILLGTGTGSGGNAGTAGASVRTGDQFYARKNVQIGLDYQPIDPNVALNVFLNGPTEGLKLWSGANPAVKLISDNYNQFVVMGNGKTSIGANTNPSNVTPYKTLTVNGDASFANYGNPTDGLNAFEIVNEGTNNNKPLRRGISVDNDPNGNVNFWINSNQTPSCFKFKNGANSLELMNLDVNGKLSLTGYSSTAFEIKDYTANKTTFQVQTNGKTFIGTEKVIGSNADALLQVGGKVACKSLYVLKPITWSDYVLKNNYKLDDLYEEEKYILKNGHLKGVPSEKEVLEKGYDINEMNAALLAKLEASYLHIIKLQKEVDELKEKIK